MGRKRKEKGERKQKQRSEERGCLFSFSPFLCFRLPTLSLSLTITGNYVSSLWCFSFSFFVLVKRISPSSLHYHHHHHLTKEMGAKRFLASPIPKPSSSSSRKGRNNQTPDQKIMTHTQKRALCQPIKKQQKQSQEERRRKKEEEEKGEGKRDLVIFFCTTVHRLPPPHLPPRSFREIGKENPKPKKKALIFRNGEIWDITGYFI